MEPAPPYMAENAARRRLLIFVYVDVSVEMLKWNTPPLKVGYLRFGYMVIGKGYL